MSKCWYCNNELTTGDNPKHFGICNKCYDEMFKSGDTIIRSFTNKIADLEAKLAESKSELEKQKEKYDKLYGRYKKTSSEDLQDKYCLAEENEQLKQQLAEKDKEQNQKAIEQLEKVKGNINKLPITDITDYGGFKKIYQADATRIIDQQIALLKGKVEDE